MLQKRTSGPKESAESLRHNHSRRKSDGCPMFGPGVHGPKTDSSNAFTSCARILDLGRCLCAYTPKALSGLRPSYSAHVRFGEHGAPVRLPSAFVMLPAALSG